MGCVIITGGSRGAGKQTALKFAREGHDVVITYCSNRPAADEVVNAIEGIGQNGIAVQMDVGKQQDIDCAFDLIETQVGQIDWLYNNAGILNELREMRDQSWESWLRILSVDVIGQWHCSKRAVENMVRHGNGGAILYCASISSVMAFPMASDYAAAKHAVAGMAKAQALECTQHNIRINTLSPGFLKTDMYEDNFGAATEMLTQSMIPASRIAEAEEIANMAYWILVEGTYCYGSNIIADGGITAGPKHQATSV